MVWCGRLVGVHAWLKESRNLQPPLSSGSRLRHILTRQGRHQWIRLPQPYFVYMRAGYGHKAGWKYQVAYDAHYHPDSVCLLCQRWPLCGQVHCLRRPNLYICDRCKKEGQGRGWKTTLLLP
jgi:hypothetical protein